MNEKEFERLKTRIADTAARHDIEWQCERCRIDGNWWYDTNDVDEDGRKWVDDAVTYLRARRLIVERSGLVMFIESPKVVPLDVRFNRESDSSLISP